MTERNERIFYWDIDGCILNYAPETVKPRLADGQLQRLLERKGFARLVCVSGWTSLVLEAPFPWRALSEFEQKESIRQYVQEAFPDRDLFHARVVLASDNDHRGQHIDLQADWFYVDDWAREFFVAAHGESEYEKYTGTRILMCDPNSDGSDIVAWLEDLPDRGC
jgi:hypothetical protein